MQLNGHHHKVEVNKAHIILPFSFNESNVSIIGRRVYHKLSIPESKMDTNIMMLYSCTNNLFISCLLHKGKIVSAYDLFISSLLEG